MVIAILLTPILATMQGLDVDTPDSSFAPNWPVMAVYGLWFTFGWWLFRHPSWLQIAAKRWRSLLVLGLLASLVGAGLAAVRVTAGPWATAHADVLRWAASFATSLTMTLSVAGWTGLFVARFDRPSRRSRYVADASYFVYIVHLPVVVALQVWWVHAALPWWIQVPLINAITLGVLLSRTAFGRGAPPPRLGRSALPRFAVSQSATQTPRAALPARARGVGVGPHAVNHDRRVAASSTTTSQ